MKPLTAALVSAGVTFLVGAGIVAAGNRLGWFNQTPVPDPTRIVRPENSGQVRAPDIAAEVRKYLAANPDLFGGPSPMLSVTADGGPVSSGSLTTGQRMEIAGLVRDILLNNPEIVRDAMEALEKKVATEQAAVQRQAIAENHSAIFSAPAPRQVVLGNPDGDVTLVEFFDYNCTYCRRAQADMRRLIEEDANLRVVLKEFPVLGPGSVEAAQVAVALNIVAPDKYEAFHDRMLTDTSPASGERALAIAATLGVDRAALVEAVSDSRVKQAIDEVYAIANSLSLNGTPSYVIGDDVVVGAVGFDALKAKIMAARGATKTTEAD
jgi:protein-disulfide isomerase